MFIHSCSQTHSLEGNANHTTSQKASMPSPALSCPPLPCPALSYSLQLSRQGLEVKFHFPTSFMSSSHTATFEVDITMSLFRDGKTWAQYHTAPVWQNTITSQVLSPPLECPCLPPTVSRV